MNFAAAKPEAAFGAAKDKEMTSNRVTMPGWLMPVMITLLLAFVANLGASFYWAGQVASNQAHMVEAMVELKVEVRQLRNDNQDLREQLAKFATARQRERR